jgi:hypothetical protein
MIPVRRRVTRQAGPYFMTPTSEADPISQGLLQQARTLDTPAQSSQFPAKLTAGKAPPDASPK